MNDYKKPDNDFFDYDSYKEQEAKLYYFRFEMKDGLADEEDEIEPDEIIVIEFYLTEDEGFTLLTGLYVAYKIAVKILLYILKAIIGFFSLDYRLVIFILGFLLVCRKLQQRGIKTYKQENAAEKYLSRISAKTITFFPIGTIITLVCPAHITYFIYIFYLLILLLSQELQPLEEDIDKLVKELVLNPNVKKTDQILEILEEIEQNVAAYKKQKEEEKKGAYKPNLKPINRRINADNTDGLLSTEQLPKGQTLNAGDRENDHVLDSLYFTGQGHKLPRGSYYFFWKMKDVAGPVRFKSFIKMYLETLGFVYYYCIECLYHLSFIWLLKRKYLTFKLRCKTGPYWRLPYEYKKKMRPIFGRNKNRPLGIHYGGGSNEEFFFFDYENKDPLEVFTLHQFFQGEFERFNWFALNEFFGYATAFSLHVIFPLAYLFLHHYGLHYLFGTRFYEIYMHEAFFLGPEYANRIIKNYKDVTDRKFYGITIHDQIDKEYEYTKYLFESKFPQEELDRIKPYIEAIKKIRQKDQDAKGGHLFD